MDRGTKLQGAGEKLYKLEALRGLAAIYVVLHHVLPHKYLVSGINLYNVFRFGQEAVIQFFILSGFVISYSFTQSRNKSFTHYFLKRFLRIYIPLACVFLLSYVIISHASGRLINPELSSLFGNIFMLQDWAKVKPHTFFDPYLQNNPLWSLSYEWWFYMLFFPITAFIKSSQLQDKVVFSSCLVAAVVYMFYPVFPVRIAMYFAIWWTGVVLAKQYMKSGDISVRALKLPVLSLLGMVAILFVDTLMSRFSGERLLFGMHPVLELRHFSFTLVAVIAAIMWHRAGWPMFDRLIKPFAILAPISYTIYILHVPLMTQSSFLNWIESPLVQWLGYFAILIALSYLIELVIYPGARRWFTNRFTRSVENHSVSVSQESAGHSATSPGQDSRQDQEKRGHLEPGLKSRKMSMKESDFVD